MGVPAVNKDTWAIKFCKLSDTLYFSMAPLTRSVHYQLPELSLQAPRVESKDIQLSHCTSPFRSSKACRFQEQVWRLFVLQQEFISVMCRLLWYGVLLQC